jgi:hypothetical protein
VKMESAGGVRKDPLRTKSNVREAPRVEMERMAVKNALKKEFIIDEGWEDMAGRERSSGPVRFVPPVPPVSPVGVFVGGKV